MITIYVPFSSASPTSAPSEALTISMDGVLSAAVTLLVAGIAIAVGWHEFRRQKKETDRQKRAELFSEALRAVDDYLEAPYRVRRRDGSSAARLAVTNQISDVQSRLSYYQRLLRLHASPALAACYEQTVRIAKAEAGAEMKKIWREAPTRRDSHVPLIVPYSHRRTDESLQELALHMTDSLR